MGLNSRGEVLSLTDSKLLVILNSTMHKTSRKINIHNFSTIHIGQELLQHKTLLNVAGN